MLASTALHHLISHLIKYGREQSTVIAMQRAHALQQAGIGKVAHGHTNTVNGTHPCLLKEGVIKVRGVLVRQVGILRAPNFPEILHLQYLWQLLFVEVVFQRGLIIVFAPHIILVRDAVIIHVKYTLVVVSVLHDTKMQSKKSERMSGSADASLHGPTWTDFCMNLSLDFLALGSFFSPAAISSASSFARSASVRPSHRQTQPKMSTIKL